MVRVKTRDWGDNFKDLSRHVGATAAAIVSHNRELADEKGSHQHAFGRHGWQTGWESQLIRAAAGVSPDKGHDPFGVDATIRTWGRVIVCTPTGNRLSHYGTSETGDRVIAEVEAPYQPTIRDFAPKKGGPAGQFISPMAQREAMAISKLRVRKYGVWCFGERRKNTKSNWVGVKRMVITTGRPKGSMLGLGFNFLPGATPRSEAEVRYLINAFQTRARVKVVMRNCPFSSDQSRRALKDALVALHRSASLSALEALDPVALEQMDSLCSALFVGIMAAKRVLSVWNNTNQNSATNRWELVTCYATNSPAEEAEMFLGGKNKTGAITGLLGKGGKGGQTKRGSIRTDASGRTAVVIT